MTERREHVRYSISLTARCIGGSHNENTDCEVIEISREGLALKLHLPKKIEIDSSVVLEISIPQKIRPISSVIQFKWIKEIKNSTRSIYAYTAGGKFSQIDPDDLTQLLAFAFDGLNQQNNS